MVRLGVFMQKNIIAGIIAGVIGGVILLILGGYFNVYQSMIELKTKIEQPREIAMPLENNLNLITRQSRGQSVSPDKILEIIKEQQSFFVKKSYGEYSSQCFTDSDLQIFFSKGVIGTVKENLLKNNEFLAIVLAIKEMNPVERQTLLVRAQNTFKPTWAELGRISSDGQTDAGQTAEKLIAKSIVDLFNELNVKTKEQIESMMQ